MTADYAILFPIRADDTERFSVSEGNPVPAWRPANGLVSGHVSEELRGRVGPDPRLHQRRPAIASSVVRDPITIRRPGRASLHRSGGIVPQTHRRLAGNWRDPDRDFGASMRSIRHASTVRRNCTVKHRACARKLPQAHNQPLGTIYAVTEPDLGSAAAVSDIGKAGSIRGPIRPQFRLPRGDYVFWRGAG